MKDGLRSITPLPQESLRGIVPSGVTGKLPKGIIYLTPGATRC